MKKWTGRLLIAICVVFQMGFFVVPAYAESVTEEHASALHELGLFNGTDLGFELERQPTRIEGLVLFIRLLGLEEEALYQNYSHPFSDVPAWASAYAGYAYYHGLVLGITETTFGADNPMGASDYITLVLRALGYDDSKGDFTWSTSINKAIEIALLDVSEALALYNQSITRGTLVDFSWAALTQSFKEEPSTTLAHDLVNKGIFTQQQAAQFGLWTAPQKPYLANTLARVSISSDASHMITLDDRDNVIYYDEGRSAIISLSIQGGETSSQTTLLDVKNAAYTANIDGSAVTYKDLQVEQIFYDNVRNKLIVTGCFQAIDNSMNDGWIDTSKPSTYRAAFTLENKKLVFFYQSSYPYFHSVMKDGRYLVSGYYLDDGQRQPYGSVYIWDYDENHTILLEQGGGDVLIVQDENDIYRANLRSIAKYNFGAGYFEEVSVKIDLGYYAWKKVGYTYSNGLFYYWTSEELCAIRPSGQKKELLDPDTDIEVLDMTPLPQYSENIFVTTDEAIIFYDSSSKAIRIIYANPAEGTGPVDAGISLLESYIKVHQDEINAIIASQNSDPEDLKLEVTAQGNTLVYNCTILTINAAYMGVENMNAVKQSLEYGLDTLELECEGLLDTLKEEIPSVECIQVNYLDQDGRILATRDYT